MSDKFVLNSRNPVETNARFERFGSTYRQLGAIIVSCVLIFGARVGSFAAEKKTDQVVFFSAPVATQTEVYSSPSPQAYATGVVSEGEYVEIFFRLPQGYCAIKPPQGSFSWVNGKFLRALNETDGQIELSSGKKAPSRIGGGSPETSSVVQVGLQNKQRVKIIGKTQLADGSVWYKIAPPPGEFRWIKTSDLASDPALEKIPEKLTFQAEYLDKGQAPQARDVRQENAPNRPNSNELGFSGGDYSEDSERSTQDFNREVAKLNADAFQALQKNPKSQEELNLLAKRAEELFDGAPSDDDRFFVQSVFEIIQKARAQASESQRIANNPFAQPLGDLGYYGENAFQAPGESVVNGAQYGAIPFSTPPDSFEQFDASSFDQSGQFANAPIVGDQFGSTQFLGAPFVDGTNSAAPTSWNLPDGFAYEPTPNVYQAPRTSSNVAKSGSESRRLGFAFSGSNTPFRSKKREARIVYGASKPSSQTSSRLSKLPSLFPSGSQEIVPPSSYNNAYGIGLSPIRQNSRLIAEAQKKKNEEIAFAQAQKKLKETPNQTQALAQETPKTTTENAATPAAETNKSTAVNVASLTTKDEPGKIRQTSAFAPVASPTNQGFSAVGTLTELSNASDGAPRYALSSPSYAGGTVYLVPAEGVSLSSYVGQKVGVKGSQGTVLIGASSQKLVVVSSIFPL